MRLWTVEGNRIRLDGGAMFGNAPRPVWSRWLEPDELNRVELAGRCLLVEADGKKILLETGPGHFMDPKLLDRYGFSGGENQLLDSLRALGTDEADIDFIVLSHLHFDHIGGMIPPWPGINDPEWQLRFPNAAYVVGHRQFARSVDPTPRDRASYVPGFAERLTASGRLVLVEDGQTNVEGMPAAVSFEHYHGHTPGSLHTLIKGVAETVFYCSDMFPGPEWLHLPIVPGYDRNAEMAVDDKRRVLERAAPEKWLMAFFHAANYAVSRVALNDKGNYEAIESIGSLNGYEL